MKKYIYLILLILCIQNPSIAQQVPLGLGHYNLTPQAGGNTPSDKFGTATTPYTTAGFTKPIPTNDWWTSLIWKYETNDVFTFGNHSWRLYAHPMTFQASRYGLDVSYPKTPEIVNPHYSWTDARYRYQMTGLQDLMIHVVGMDLDAASPNPETVRTEDYGDWSVKANWNDGTNTLSATMAHGSPYVYCTKTGGDAAIWMRNTHTVDNTIGTNVIGVTTKGNHYGIFFPTGSTYSVNPIQLDVNGLTANPPTLAWRDSYVSDLNGSDYFVLALLPDNSAATLAEYAQHAFAFVDNTEVTWSYDEASAQMTTTYTATTIAKEGTEMDPIMALYRHQWLRSNDVNTTHTYVSPRGEMKVVKGNSFTTTTPNKGLIPHMPNAMTTADSILLYAYMEDERQAVNVFTYDDSYWNGKRMSRQADLVYIADQVGNTAAKNKLLNELKAELEDWLQADNGEADRGYFYYDATWSSLIGYGASFGSDDKLNDHHFHYGYFIKAAATIAHFDADWAKDSNWGSMINLIIKDVANWDKTDNMFPFLRYFDPYAGHSWASGHGNTFFGNDQESSSESMNFSASVFLWGLSTDNSTIRDLGLYLYLTEAEAIEQYWFDVDNAVYPAGFPYTHVTRVWGNGAEKVTGHEAWEQEPEYALGINLVPLEASALYLGRSPQNIANALTEVDLYNTGPNTYWDDVMWGYEAMQDPTAALSKYEAATAGGAYNANAPWLPNVTGIYEPLSGDQFAPAQLYHWLHSLDSLGQVDVTITADYPSYMVFDKNGEKSYVIYTPPNTVVRTGPVTVTFSDGTVVTVPEGQLYLHKVTPLLPVRLTSFEGNCEKNNVELNWITAIEEDLAFFEIEKSMDGVVFSALERIDAIGNSATSQRYSFLDAAENGKLYYRLKMVNVDGSYKYSEVVFITCELATEIAIYPVPFKENIQVYIPQTEDHLTIEIYDVLGRLIWEDTEVAVGNDALQISTKEWSRGAYFINIKNAAGAVLFSQRLLKI